MKVRQFTGTVQFTTSYYLYKMATATTVDRMTSLTPHGSALSSHPQVVVRQTTGRWRQHFAAAGGNRKHLNIAANETGLVSGQWHRVRTPGSVMPRGTLISTAQNSVLFLRPLSTTTPNSGDSRNHHHKHLKVT